MRGPMLARWRCVLVGVALLGFMTAAAAPVELAVDFKLSDADNQPMPQVRTRLVLGVAAGWQLPNAGQAFQTDASGEAHLTIATTIERRLRKRPTNFVDYWLSLPESTDYLQSAIELEYAGRKRLIVVKVYRFRSDASVFSDGLEVYTPDAEGNFTVPGVCLDGHSWRIPEPDGSASWHPGFKLVDFWLQPVADDTSGKRWVLRLVFSRLADPVRR